MAALVWLLIPLAAAVVAACWARWAARRRTTGDGASLADYERFRQAMQRVAPVDASRERAPVAGPAAGTARDKGRRAARTAGAGAGKNAARGLGTAPANAPGEEDSPRGPVVGPVP
ncbi:MULTISPECIES: hypothetical protein [unclassified Streptomyces]|uniref:hypothetical protein n=1 Tax=unclassified Streptomyces TaxID=2593676 RepID=UPI002E27D07D|nr:hypothetical protein [Streptomyces sp. NBC_00223]